MLASFQYDVLNPIRACRGIPPESFFSGSALVDRKHASKEIS
jgi:hypothetical protein